MSFTITLPVLEENTIWIIGTVLVYCLGILAARKIAPIMVPNPEDSVEKAFRCFFAVLLFVFSPLVLSVIILISSVVFVGRIITYGVKS